MPALGYFYVVQTASDLDEKLAALGAIAPTAGRVKLGWTCRMGKRMGEHSSVAPSSDVLAFWPCDPQWEGPAIKYATSQVQSKMVCGRSRKRSEVYDVQDVQAVLNATSYFFYLVAQHAATFGGYGAELLRDGAWLLPLPGAIMWPYKIHLYPVRNPDGSLARYRRVKVIAGREVVA